MKSPNGQKLGRRRAELDGLIHDNFIRTWRFGMVIAGETFGKKDAMIVGAAVLLALLLK